MKPPEPREEEVETSAPRSTSVWGAVAQIAFIVLAAVVVYYFVSAARQDERRSSCSALCAFGPSYAGQNRMAPDFELPDMKGKPVRLSSFRGKTVYLNFWTKTCGPCLEEMPSLAELARIAKNRDDFVVVTVSTDDGPADVLDTLQVTLNGEAPFPVLFDPDLKVVRDKFGTVLYPETWIIDPKGMIRARFDGERDWSMPIAVELGQRLGHTGSCPVEFFRSKPRGTFAGVCEDEG